MQQNSPLKNNVAWIFGVSGLKGSLGSKNLQKENIKREEIDKGIATNDGLDR